ncbi:MAG: NAD(P)/FAD-dependent oxidoreductase [Chitinophagales bacterium]
MKTMKGKQQYDVIIIGGSYAGLSAGMALGRALRSVLIIDSGTPCNSQTPYSHNFLTNDGVAPAEISKLARKQVLAYTNVVFIDAFATKGRRSEDGFEIEIGTGDKFTSRKLIFATGIKDIIPAIPGFAESWGISALHCPYCHGYEIYNQKTGVLANGDTAFELVTLISNWTMDLTLYTNGKSVLTEQQRIKLDQHNIAIVEAEIDKLENQKGYIESIVFNNGTKADLSALYARLPFVQHSAIPQSLGCELTQEGYIKTDAGQKTTVPGVFACGDNSTRMRTVSNAVYAGTAAAFSTNRELIEENF